MTTKSKIFAVLCYLSFLVLIPVLFVRDDEFVQYHVKQGLKLLACILITLFILGILGEILFIFGLIILFSEYFFLSIVLWIFCLTVAAIVTIFFLILSIIGIVNSAKGVKKPLPFINIILKSKQPID